MGLSGVIGIPELLPYLYGMVKRILFVSILLILGTTGHAQKEFGAKTLRSEAGVLANDIQEYAGDLGHPGVERNLALDSVAEGRVNYFISVMRESARDQSLKSLVYYIPKNSDAHDRYFGDPGIFKEPTGATYPDLLPFVSSLSLKVRSEIMSEAIYRLYDKNSLSNQVLVDKAMRFFRETRGKSFFLENYKTSPHHHRSIINYAKNQIGVCVKALTSKEWDSEQAEWKYEVLIYSLAVFSE